MHIENEKDAYGVSHVDEAVVESSQSDLSVDEEFTPQEQHKIIHRIDSRLVSVCGLTYCISLMDRTNLSAAAIAGYDLPHGLYFPFRCLKKLTTAAE